MPAPTSEPPALHDRALQDLSFIRRTMEGVASFTDVPGWGLVGVGATALVAAPMAHRQSDPEGWLTAWLAAAVVGASPGGAAMYAKMRRRMGHGGTLRLSVPARKFLLSFWPATRAVPMMGFGFVALGVLALFVPAANGDPMMALGFGVLHMIFGARIARRHVG